LDGAIGAVQRTRRRSIVGGNAAGSAKSKVGSSKSTLARALRDMNERPELGTVDPGTGERRARQILSQISAVIADSASLTHDPGVAHGRFYFRCHCGRHANQRQADFGQHAL
jgi:hypothetical protein